MILPISMIMPFSVYLSCDTEANPSLVHSISLHYAPISPGSYVLVRSPCFAMGIPMRARRLSPAFRYLISACSHFRICFAIVSKMHSLVEICAYVLSATHHVICTRRTSPYHHRPLFNPYITIHHAFQWHVHLPTNYCITLIRRTDRM